MDAFDNTVRDYLNFLDNEYISAGLSLFLVLYAGLAAPKLPEYIASVFDNMFVKLVMFFLIVYISRRNATVAVIASIAVLVSIMTLNRIKFNKEMMQMVNSEESQFFANKPANYPSRYNGGYVDVEENNDYNGYNDVTGVDISCKNAKPLNQEDSNSSYENNNIEGFEVSDITDWVRDSVDRMPNPFRRRDTKGVVGEENDSVESFEVTVPGWMRKSKQPMKLNVNPLTWMRQEEESEE